MHFTDPQDAQSKESGALLDNRIKKDFLLRKADIMIIGKSQKKMMMMMMRYHKPLPLGVPCHNPYVLPGVVCHRRIVPVISRQDIIFISKCHPNLSKQKEGQSSPSSDRQRGKSRHGRKFESISIKEHVFFYLRA